MRHPVIGNLTVVLALSLAIAASPALGQSGGHNVPTMAWPGGDVPSPEVDLPDFSSPDADVSSAANGADMPLNFGEAQEGLPYPSMELPSEVQSSGSWLRRGFWYAEQDVVVLNRTFFRNTLLAFDNTLSSDRELNIEADKPDSAASGRFTLGRFLFRDEKNNDHQVEFTFFGLGEWFAARSVESADTNELFSPFGGDRFLFNPPQPGGPFNSVIGGFNAADFQQFFLKSEFNSFELNYRLRHRPPRDRLELGPDGKWVRKLRTNTFHTYLFGLRYFDLTDEFRWRSLGVTNDLDPGQVGVERTEDAEADLQIHTDNDLLGLQFGAGIIHQQPRWSVGVRGKAGPYINFTEQHTNLFIRDTSASRFAVDPTTGAPIINEIVPATDVDEQLRATEETFTFLAELGVFAHYHLFPNVTLRTAYEAMWLTSVATARDQITLHAGSAPIVRTGGSQMYMGMSFGIDFYW